jgi:N6-L-threonylcarbamoyladenine synthase
MLLAVETSCDETAVCVAKLNDNLNDYSKNIIFEEISSQVDLHREYGGVVPELAAREHINNLPLLINRALESVKVESLKAIAVTRGPGLKGCLLVGMSYCKALAQSLAIPLIPVNHLEGHFYSGFLISKSPEFPILTLLVSGGHTTLFLVTAHGAYQPIARTRDDAAGEAFDKGATLLGLPYPGGPSLSKCADLGDASQYTFPISMPEDNTSFSFSGLKTALLREVKQRKDLASQEVNNLSAAYQAAIVNALVLKSIAACKTCKPKSFLLTGGVAANLSLRKKLEKEVSTLGIEFFATPQKWCTDNAAMIAVAAQASILKAPELYKNWKKQKGSLGPNVSSDIGVLSRWPIGES